MSLRIIGPPARSVTWFDDGDLQPAANVLDEDYSFTQCGLVAALYPQPAQDTDEIGGIAVTVEEDSSSPPASAVALVAPQPQGDDGDLPILITYMVDEDLNAPALLITLPYRPTQQAVTDDEVLPLSRTVVDDDRNGLPLETVSAQHVIAQPTAVNDELALITIDEDGSLTVSALRVAVYTQPAAADEDLPPVIYAVDDDVNAAFYASIPRFTAQPLADDADLPLSGRAVDEDIPWVGPALKAVYALQPTAGENDLSIAAVTGERLILEYDPRRVLVAMDNRRIVMDLDVRRIVLPRKS